MGRTIEELIGQIKGIYQQFGYSQFKMNKFEEYDIYVNNKDFLKSDKVITFTDTNGKLLAMKPDVTISIIRNYDDASLCVQKAYYNENVYRVSDGTHSFKEIMQSGLECIGDVDEYSIAEVIILAAKSLAAIDENYMLDISHMGLTSSLLKAAKIDENNTQKFLQAISEKNFPEFSLLCKEENLSNKWVETLSSLITMYGPIDEVSEKLDIFAVDEETSASVNDLCEISKLLKGINLSKNVQIDFSVVNDMNYYNKIVFKGYIEGIASGILSGGQYDRLIAKIGKKAKGLGFAIYLDMLEMLFTQSKEYDADICLYYDKNSLPEDVLSKVKEITDSGKSVLALNSENNKVLCKEKIYLTKEVRQN